MKFWDASAIVALLVAEEASSYYHALYQEDRKMTAWFFSSTEILSALSKCMRHGSISFDTFQTAKYELSALADRWFEITPSDAVRGRANRLVETHAISAADALQLAAALVGCNEKTKDTTFVTLDLRLRAAAQKEGFNILPEKGN